MHSTLTISLKKGQKATVGKTEVEVRRVRKQDVSLRFSGPRDVPITRHDAKCKEPKPHTGGQPTLDEVEAADREAMRLDTAETTTALAVLRERLSHRRACLSGQGESRDAILPRIEAAEYTLGMLAQDLERLGV